MSKPPPPVIDLVSSSEDEDEDEDDIHEVGTSSIAGRSASTASTAASEPAALAPPNFLAGRKRPASDSTGGKRKNPSSSAADGGSMAAAVAAGSKRPASAASAATGRNSRKSSSGSSGEANAKRVLQAGIVLEEDITGEPGIGASADQQPASCRSYVQAQFDRIRCGLPPLLYHDRDFEPVPTSIDGMNSISPILDDVVIPKSKVVKCRCTPALPAAIAYSTREGPNKHRPYYTCARQGGGNTKCKFFQWALNSHTVRWHRYGTHTGHVLVGPAGFRADDLLQGKVGDCWFLSALAVVAERPDLIRRLFETMSDMNEHGVVEVRLFVDGFWKNIVMDNFLPCMVDPHNDELGRAVQASLEGMGSGPGSTSNLSHEWGAAADTANNAVLATTSSAAVANDMPSLSSSSRDPHALSECNLSVIRRTYEYLEHDRYRKNGPLPPGERSPYNRVVPRRLPRTVQTEDLAYSKGKSNQLWVPLLEKAYAKMNGCYKAISGGFIEEAFLDLTGAPTLVYHFDAPTFNARVMWADLMSFRARNLPMGCGTTSSAVGIIGMHAYSILDVREVRDVSFDFFSDAIVSGTHGNVSGFTEFDGTVRLLRIRNPHGKGEWKGPFSDGDAIWEKLLASRRQNMHANSPALERTMKEDGIFWIDYESFLLGFSNVDVVLAFEGNHAKSFRSNFPLKTSNHRCARAFEVSLLDEQPGLPSDEKVEVYVMGIQATQRGSKRGRSDRKKSYKISDLGIVVGKHADGGRNAFESRGGDEEDFDEVAGHCFGFSRNGHYRLLLDREKCKSLVVMPVSFGHPAATDDDRSFAVRFVTDCPVMIRELCNPPRMDIALKKLFFAPKDLRDSLKASVVGTSSRRGIQGAQHVVFADTEGKRKYGEPAFRVMQIDYLANEGGVVFVYLAINDRLIAQHQELQGYSLSLSIEATCRGMTCRTADGLPQHETIAKGKKFEAAWRRYTCSFENERKSRLLMVLVQSGQSTEFGHVKCEKLVPPNNTGGANALIDFLGVSPALSRGRDDYDKMGIFNPVAFDFGATFFQRNLPTLSDSSVATVDLGGFSGGGDDQPSNDQDLERALALSRQEANLQRAIEESKYDVFVGSQKLPSSSTTSTFDSDMAAAIAASVASTSTLDTGGETASDRDLELAMKLSKEESMGPEIVDLLGDNDDDDDVDDDGDNEYGLTCNMKGSTESGTKPPLHSKENETVIESEADVNKVPAIADCDTTMFDDPAEKRRLTAEAAMKRFAS